MILSDHGRRWAEIRLYQFCVDIFDIRNKTIDIIELADEICKIGGLKENTIKRIIGAMMNEPYYRPDRREIILLAHLNNVKTMELAASMGMTKQGVNKYIRTHLDNFTPFPRCKREDDYEIVRFLEILDKIKKAGL